jgi:hypothetical protein
MPRSITQVPKEYAMNEGFQVFVIELAKKAVTAIIMGVATKGIVEWICAPSKPAIAYAPQPKHERSPRVVVVPDPADKYVYIDWGKFLKDVDPKK